MQFNKSQILKQAHAIARNIVATGVAYRAALSQGAKMAWEKAKKEAVPFAQKLAKSAASDFAMFASKCGHKIVKNSFNAEKCRSLVVCAIAKSEELVFSSNGDTCSFTIIEAGKPSNIVKPTQRFVLNAENGYNVIAMFRKFKAA